MADSKKNLSSSRSSRTTTRQSERRRSERTPSDQSRTRSFSQDEIRTIRNRSEGSASSSTMRRRSETAQKNRNDAARRKAVREIRERSAENGQNRRRTDQQSEKRARTNHSNVSGNASERRTQKTAQRRAASRHQALTKPSEAFRGPKMNPPKKRRRPWPKPIKIIILSCLLLLVGGTAYGWFLITGNLNTDLNDLSLRKTYHISSEAAAMSKSQRIVNVAVFGIDGREGVEGDRSDAMMIASADFEHGGIKIASIMRDTYVWVEAEDCYDKINAAYAFGGEEAALQTINENFDTAVTDYVTIDFNSMVLMVNAVDGVEVTIEDQDVLDWTNVYIDDVNMSCGTSSAHLTGLGTQTLDGSQALAYCRVRYTGNGDFDRAMRQREVFKQVVVKALDLNPFAQYALLQDVMPYVETSLTTNEIMKYALNVMFMKSKAFTQMQLPVDDYCEAGYYDDVSYVFPVRLEDSIKAWYRFVYEKDYTLSSTAQEISDEIAWFW